MARRTVVIPKYVYRSGAARDGKATLLYDTSYANAILAIQTRAGEEFFRKNKNTLGGVARAVVEFHYRNTLEGTINILAKGIPGAARFKSSVRVPLPAKSAYSRSAAVIVKPHPLAGWQALALSTRKRKKRTRSLGQDKFWKDQPTLITGRIRKRKVKVEEVRDDDDSYSLSVSDDGNLSKLSLRDQMLSAKRQRLANLVKIALAGTQAAPSIVLGSELRNTKTTKGSGRRASFIDTEIVVKIRNRLPDPLDELLRRAFVIGDVEEATRKISHARSSSVEKLDVLSYLEFGASRQVRTRGKGKTASSALPPRPFLRAYAARMGRDSQLQSMKALRKALRSTSV